MPATPLDQIAVHLGYEDRGGHGGEEEHLHLGDVDQVLVLQLIALEHVGEGGLLGTLVLVVRAVVVGDGAGGVADVGLGLLHRVVGRALARLCAGDERAAHGRGEADAHQDEQLLRDGHGREVPRAHVAEGHRDVRGQDDPGPDDGLEAGQAHRVAVADEDPAPALGDGCAEAQEEPEHGQQHDREGVRGKGRRKGQRGEDDDGDGNGTRRNRSEGAAGTSCGHGLSLPM